MNSKSSKDVPVTNSVDNKCRVKITVSRESKKLMMNEGIKEFLNHHPEMKGFNITEAFIFRQIVEHYLR